MDERPFLLLSVLYVIDVFFIQVTFLYDVFKVFFNFVAFSCIKRRQKQRIRMQNCSKKHSEDDWAMIFIDFDLLRNAYCKIF